MGRLGRNRNSGGTAGAPPLRLSRVLGFRHRHLGLVGAAAVAEPPPEPLDLPLDLLRQIVAGALERVKFRSDAPRT